MAGADQVFPGVERAQKARHVRMPGRHGLGVVGVDDVHLVPELPRKNTRAVPVAGNEIAKPIAVGCQHRRFREIVFRTNEWPPVGLNVGRVFPEPVEHFRRAQDVETVDAEHHSKAQPLGLLEHVVESPRVAQRDAIVPAFQGVHGERGPGRAQPHADEVAVGFRILRQPVVVVKGAARPRPAYVRSDQIERLTSIRDEIAVVLWMGARHARDVGGHNVDRNGF